MAEALLILMVLATFIYGYFLMRRLDRFLEENRKEFVEKEQEGKESNRNEKKEI